MRLFSSVFSLLTLLSPFTLFSNDLQNLEDKPICTRSFSKQPISLSFASTYADIALWDSGGRGRPVIFIHGNSCCKEVFAQQFDSELAQQYRLIAFDLPGHGQSSKATDPEKAYSIDGHVQVLYELIEELDLQRPFLVGWSLGGHVALDALAKGLKCSGVLITGTPPIEISYAGFSKGWLPMPEVMNLWSKEKFSKEEALLFLGAIHCGIDLEQNPFLLEAVLKTEGRSQLAKSITLKPYANQKTVVETNDTPLCIILGAEDNLNLDYMTKQVKYKNLFKDKVQLVEGTGHTVFWDKSHIFNGILADFLAEN